MTMKRRMNDDEALVTAKLIALPLVAVAAFFLLSLIVRSCS